MVVQIRATGQDLPIVYLSNELYAMQERTTGNEKHNIVQGNLFLKFTPVTLGYHMN